MTSASAIVLGASLIIIMFGMGLSLTPVDFKRVIVYPKAMIIGLVNQLILLPAIGFALIRLFPVQPEIAVGLILLAACPGGPTSNLITHLAKGDTALSVSLTAVSSVITVFTIPFIVNRGLITAKKLHSLTGWIARSGLQWLHKLLKSSCPNEYFLSQFFSLRKNIISPIAQVFLTYPAVFHRICTSNCGTILFPGESARYLGGADAALQRWCCLRQHSYAPAD